MALIKVLNLNLINNYIYKDNIANVRNGFLLVKIMFHRPA